MEKVYVTESQVEQFVFEALVRAGYAPSHNDSLMIADIMFDFMIEKGILTDGL